MPPRRRRAWLGLICLVGLLLRIGWALFAAPEPIADFRGYLDAANAVAQTDPLAYLARSTAYRLPVYPVVLGVGAAVSSNLVWLRLWNVALSTGLLPLVMVVGRRLGLSDRAALVATGLVALSPTFIMFAPLMAAEHVMLLLVLAALAVAAAQHAAASAARVLAVGVFAGLAALARVEAVFVWPAIVVAYSLSLRHRTRLPVAARAGRVLAALAAAVLLLVAWSARNAAVVGSGAGVTTSLGVQLYLAHNPDTYGFTPLARTPLRGLDELTRHRRGLTLAGEYVADHPASLLLSATRGTRDLFGVASTRTVFAHPTSVEDRMPLGLLAAVTSLAANGWRMLLLVAFAAFAFRKRIPAAAVAVGAALVTTTWLGHALVLYGEPRYRLGIVVVAAMAAGVTLDGLLARRQPASEEDLSLERWSAVSEETVLVRTVTEVAATPELPTPAEPPSDDAWQAEEPATTPEPEPTQWWGPIPRAEWSAAPEPEPEPEPTAAVEEVRDPAAEPLQAQSHDVWRPQPVDASEPVPEETPAAEALRFAENEEVPPELEAAPAPQPEIIYVHRRAARRRPAPPAEDVEVIIPRHRATRSSDRPASR